MPETPNHRYNVPREGAEEWHVPLNENFRQYDTDIEIRDTAGNRTNYRPKAGAKFLATDTGIVFLGTGDSWEPTLAVARMRTLGATLSVAFGDASNTMLAPVSGAVLAGGEKNTIEDDRAVIAGGFNNIVDDGGELSTIGGGVRNATSGVNSVIGGGENNSASATNAAVGGGTGNRVSGYAATVGGGEANNVTEAFGGVASGLANAVEAQNGVVAGGNGNTVTGQNGTIGGGAANEVDGDTGTICGGAFNRVLATYGTIAGGGPTDTNDKRATRNVVFDSYGTIAGGGNNQAGSDDGNTQDPTNAVYATVGGGRSNTATASSATVGGGDSNTANGRGSTVGGGSANDAGGEKATVPGGDQNVATGDYSFAAGRQAEAAARGAFVWADATEGAVRSSVENEFKTQSTGGAVFYTSPDLSTGVAVGAGEGTWSSISARSAKRNVSPVDSQSVLEAVERIDVSRWEYDTDSDATHMGPMAGEFHDAFGLGRDAEHIDGVDADGVALAAIQELSQQLDQKDERIEELESELATKDAQIEAISERLATLEQQVQES